MSIFRDLGENVSEVGVMTVTIVLISLLLNSIRNQNIGESICPGVGGTPNNTVYNITQGLCHNTTNYSETSAISAIGSNINTSVTGIGTPITYITIIILVVVFSTILVMLVQKLRNRT